MLTLFPPDPTDPKKAKAPAAPSPTGIAPASPDAAPAPSPGVAAAPLPEIPVIPPSNVGTLVLLNPKSGTIARADPPKLAEQIAKEMPGARVELREADELIDLVRETSDDPNVSRVLVGGGDGTINSVAHELVGTGVPLGVFSLGTMNYLAKELGIPADVGEATRWLAAAEPRPLSVGQVNGRTFCLFAEVGMYGLIVKHRDVQRKATGRSKYVAMVHSFVRALRRKPVWGLTIEHDGRKLRRTTPLLYVGVSDYHMDVMGLPPELRRGRSTLSLLVAKETSRLGLLVMLVRSFCRTLRVGRDLEWIAGDRFVIRSRRQALRVAIDGEVLQINTPLTVEFVKDGLTVLAANAAVAKQA